MELLFSTIFPVILFLSFFAAIWMAVCYVLSKAGGWDKLAQVYRYDGKFSGKRWRFRSCKMNGYISYSGCLTFGASSAGLYIKVFPLFSFHHPPLLIPWSQIEKGKNNVSGYFNFRLSFSSVPGVQIFIFESLGEKIFSASREQKYDHEFRPYRKIEPE